MRRLLRAALAILAFGSFVHLLHAEDQTYFLVLDGPSAAEVALATPKAVGKAAVVNPATLTQQRIAEIQSAHAALEPLLELNGAKITGRYARLANAIAVRTSTDSLATLSTLPGVVRIDRVQQFTRLLETSVPWVGAPRLWGPASTNATGKGMRIGIIDSGIDYHHASLGGSGKPDDYANDDPTIIEIGSFPTSKVIGGYDFAGDDFDSSGENGDPVPVPDDDPLDPRANGHGSHVASTAAGNGVLTNGASFKGPYTSITPMSQFTVAPGVAPEARLYALKVFGSQGSTSGDLILSALEFALDPDENGDFSDKLEVVNLSLGGTFEPAGTGDVESTGVNLLSQSGTTVVVAAGNSGNIHFVTGLPANVDNAITVANSIDDGASFSTIKVTAPAALVGDYTSVEGEFTRKLSAVGPITASIVQISPNDACGSILNAAAIQGKIALIDRGTCFFVDKIRRAQTAGAIGVIMVNNVDGPPIPMGGSGDTSDIKIPGVMIRLEDGKLLKSQLGNGVVVTLAAFAAVARPELADQLENSSSRGPRLPDGHLKPDIAAPGTSINAVEAGSGVRGRVYSGTSMASPHVAGAAILIKQRHPDWTPLQIKMALMNSAVRMKNDRGIGYPESRIGAGRLQVDQAANLTTLARLDTKTGEVALSFGALQLLTPYTTTRDVRIFNLSNQSRTYRLSVSNTTASAGVTLTPLKEEITIPARSEGLATFRYNADPTLFDRTPDPTTPPINGDKARYQLFEASGQVWIRSATESIHVPWHSIVQALSDTHVTANTIGLPATADSLVALPTRGINAHSQPTVAVLQLGATSPNRNFSDERASGDLLAVGAASDFPTKGSMATTTISFGFAAAGIWRTPQRVFESFDIEIDLNNDGRAEYTLLNSTSGNLLSGQLGDPQDMTDAFLTLVQDNSKTTGNLTAGSPLNLLPPTVRDTAPFFNSAALLGAPASAIGLTSVKTAFRYRLVLNGDGFAENSIWISFDAAKPLVDGTANGIQGTPLFDEGRSPSAIVHRSNALAAGFGAAKPLQALLLHLHNQPGNQVDLVTFNLNNADTDGDGLADLDEVRNFGDLTSNGTGDQDGDGMSDRDEVIAKTDPRDASSILKLLPMASGGSAVRWISAAGATYIVERADKPQGPYTQIQTNIQASPPLNSFTDPAPGASTTFYRIRVQ